MSSSELEDDWGSELDSLSDELDCAALRAHRRGLPLAVLFVLGEGRSHSSLENAFRRHL